MNKAHEDFIRENTGKLDKLTILQILTQSVLMNIHPNTVLETLNRITKEYNKFIAERL